MVEGGGGPEFPVVFFDGEREMNIGDVRIYPTLEYKPFQQMLSQKIGISPNQISIYLVAHRKRPKPPFSEDRHRIPITGKVNFSLICRQKDCSFLVVLKRSRKARNRRERAMHGLDLADFLPESEFPRPVMHSSPENLVLLRRNQQVPFHDQIMRSQLAELNYLEAQGESYQMALARENSNAPPPPYFVSECRDSVEGTFMDLSPDFDSFFSPHSSRKAYCEDCVNEAKNEVAPSFHPCVNDAVVTRFTTRSGPIRRP